MREVFSVSTTPGSSSRFPASAGAAGGGVAGDPERKKRKVKGDAEFVEPGTVAEKMERVRLLYQWAETVEEEQLVRETDSVEEAASGTDPCVFRRPLLKYVDPGLQAAAGECLLVRDLLARGFATQKDLSVPVYDYAFKPRDEDDVEGPFTRKFEGLYPADEDDPEDCACGAMPHHFISEWPQELVDFSLLFHEGGPAYSGLHVDYVPPQPVVATLHRGLKIWLCFSRKFRDGAFVLRGDRTMRWLLEYLRAPGTPKSDWRVAILRAGDSIYVQSMTPHAVITVSGAFPGDVPGAALQSAWVQAGPASLSLGLKRKAAMVASGSRRVVKNPGTGPKKNKRPSFAGKSKKRRSQSAARS